MIKICFSFHRLTLGQNDGVFCHVEATQFPEAPNFIPVPCANGVLFKKAPVPMESRLFPSLSSTRLSVSGALLRSLVHLELSLVQGLGVYLSAVFTGSPPV